MGTRKTFPVGTVALMGCVCALAAVVAATGVTRSPQPTMTSSAEALLETASALSAIEPSAAPPTATLKKPPGIAIELEQGETASPPSKPVVENDPRRFIGAKPDFLLEELGQPSSLRKEAPAEVWQYRSEQCVLDIVLYDEADGPSVVYLEARDLYAEPAEAGPCLSRLLDLASVSDS